MHACMHKLCPYHPSPSLFPSTLSPTLGSYTGSSSLTSKLSFSTAGNTFRLHFCAPDFERTPFLTTVSTYEPPGSSLSHPQIHTHNLSKRLVVLQHRLSKLQTSIWVLSLNRYSWRWTFMLCTNLSMPGSFRQSLEANLLSTQPMWLNTALHLKISGEARPSCTNQDHFIKVTNLLAVLLTSLNRILRTRTRRKVLVLPSPCDLVRIRNRNGLSGVEMPRVKAKLLTKYPLLIKSLWNQSWSRLKKISFHLAFFRHRKIMTWKTCLPLLHMWVGTKKIVGWI